MDRAGSDDGISNVERRERAILVVVFIICGVFAMFVLDGRAFLIMALGVLVGFVWGWIDRNKQGRR